MAYASYNVSSVLELVQAVSDFANAQGWNVTQSGTSNSVATIQAPGDAGNLNFVVSALSGSTVQTTQMWVYGEGETGDTQARTSFDSYTAWDGSGPWGGPPSVAHFFTELGPSPWFAAAVECSNGSFRNFCFGYLQKIGTYDGGEFVGGTQRSGLNTFVGQYDDHQYIALMLSGSWHRLYNPRRGGVRVNGTWTPFCVLTANDLDAKHLVGAPPYLSPAVAGNVAANAFSGYAPSLPIPIYEGTLNRTDSFWRPLGYPIGIRQIDMANFFPSQEFTLPDNSVWRAFPALRKATVIPSDKVETSGNLGYAFRVSEG